MIEATLTEEQKKDDLLALYRAASGFLEDLKAQFPGHKISLEIRENSEEYWFDGNCYTEERRYYIPEEK